VLAKANAIYGLSAASLLRAVKPPTPPSLGKKAKAGEEGYGNREAWSLKTSPRPSGNLRVVVSAESSSALNTSAP